MDKLKLGVLRVLTTDDENILNIHGELLEKYFPEVKTETKCIPDQPNGIYDDESHKIAVPKIISLAKRWQESLDGLIISCAGDPAVEKLKGILSIPVTGAGTPTAAYSLNIGKKVGIIGIGKKAPQSYIEVLGNNLIGYEKPHNVKNTNDLQTKEGKKEIIRSAQKLEEKGGQVIAFACTGLSTAKASLLLKEHVSIPVIDAVFAEGLMMIGMCRYRKVFGGDNL